MPLVQGRWLREAGENPARTRHCDRGSPPLAASSRGHWRAARTGKARTGRAREPGDLLRPKAHTPSRKGVASMQILRPRAGLAAGALGVAVLAAPAAAPAKVPVQLRIEGAKR